MQHALDVLNLSKITPNVRERGVGGGGVLEVFVALAIMQWLLHSDQQDDTLRARLTPGFCGSIGASCLSFTTLSLLDVQHSVTAGARVVGVLKLVHEEGDEAAAQHQSEADEEQAHEPGVSAGLVGDVGHDLLLAGRAVGHTGVEAQRSVVAHKLLTFGIRIRG